MLNEAKQQELEAFIQSLQEEYSIPGLSVALAHNGKMIYAKGFGWADREAGLPAEPDTIYGFASVTKSFTAMAIMILEQEGKLSTGDPVTAYLPEFRFGEEKESQAATIHHFLTHSAGLPPTAALRYAMVRSIADDVSAEQLRAKGKWDEWVDRDPIDTYEDLLQFLSRSNSPLLGPCGAQFSYSNDAYALLGAIVERVSGMPFADFVQQRILEPLGMSRSLFDADELADYEQVTQLYVKDSDGQTIPAPLWNAAPAMVGAGFLKSTVADMIRYCQVYLGQRQDILSRNGAAQMTAPYLPCGRANYYGYGLMIHPNYHGMTVVEHGGSLKGIASNFGVIPEKGLAAAVVANIVDVPASRIWLAALNAALDLPLEEPLSTEPQYETCQDELQRWVGVYESDEGAEITVTVEDGTAYIEAKEQKQAIRQSGPDSGAIIYRGAEMGISFITDGAGDVAAINYGYRIVPRSGRKGQSAHADMEPDKDISA